METGIDDSKNPTENQLISEDEPTASLPMDEDMEDILEHIEEDVDLNDEEDEDEDLLESDQNTTVTENDIVTKKEVNEAENKLPSPFPTLPLPPTLNSNGLQSNPGPLPKLPPLPPLPPPLLNLEFLKVKARNVEVFIIILFCYTGTNVQFFGAQKFVMNKYEFLRQK